MWVMTTDQASPETIGERVRRLRELRGMSREELARRSGLSKTTILRFERGLPTHRRTLHQIAGSLNYPKGYLLLPGEDWDRPYHVHRRRDDVWHAANPRRKRPARFEVDPNDPDERNRLGVMGYYDAFFQPINCLLRDAHLGAAVAEIFEAGKEPAVHPGLEFVFVLSGSIVVAVGAEEIPLEEGEAITFWAAEPHNYRPAVPVKRGDAPPRCLMVVLEGPERTE